MEKFYLDLATILQKFRQNGELSADLPAKKLGNKAPWKAQLRVDEGLVTSCQILDQRGSIVHSGEPALEALYKLGPLHWEIAPDLLDGSSKLPTLNQTRKSGPLAVPPANTIPAPVPASVPDSSSADTPVPYRLLTVTLKQMNQTQWPRDYRLVYILIDGIRTTEKIANMLAMPLADVEQILRELQVMRIIDIPV
ncbi:MAG TPA: hypothetical protein VGM01_13585 [Ktedonobacteraceae bacterium]